MRAVPLGASLAVPDKVLSNHDLAKLVDTNDEWIVQRTGMRERRMCGPDDTAATLAIEAANKVLAKTGVKAEDLDLVLVGSVTGDYMFPSVSCLVQHAIGATKAGAMDVGAACAGFIYAIATATSMIESGFLRRILVIGVDTLTKFVDWTDRSTCILFGDGAGAVILEGQEGTDRGVIKTVLLSDGAGASLIDIEVGGSRHPAGEDDSAARRTKIFMAGSEVYRFAVKGIGDACCRVLDAAGMTSDEVDLFVPHQANLRIIDSAASRLQLPPEKVFVNVEKYGNTSGGSIPIALAEAEDTGRLKPGMVVMTVGFGAGLVWGANLIRW